MNYPYAKTAQAGYTLVELITVMAIISMLASIAVPGLMQAADNASLLKIRTDLKSIDDTITIIELQGLPVPATVKEITDRGYFKTQPLPPNRFEGTALNKTYQIDPNLRRGFLPLSTNGITTKFYSDTAR